VRGSVKIPNLSPENAGTGATSALVSNTDFACADATKSMVQISFKQLSRISMKLILLCLHKQNQLHPTFQAASQRLFEK
jgi:hypothetical protein